MSFFILLILSTAVGSYLSTLYSLLTSSQPHFELFSQSVSQSFTTFPTLISTLDNMNCGRVFLLMLLLEPTSSLQVPISSATSRTQYEPLPTATPDKTFDGDTTTFYHSDTTGNNQSLTLQFGSDVNVERVEIINRLDTYWWLDFEQPGPLILHSLTLVNHYESPIYNLQAG